MTRRQPRKTFTEGQVAAALADHAAGVKVPEVCRRHGISERTFYLWRRQRAAGSGATPAPGGPREET